MDDLISRQDALDWINFRLSQPCKNHTSEFVQGMEDGYCRIRSDIKCLPSAEKRGKWIVQITGWGDMYYECSYCKGAIMLIDGTPEDNFYCYCPHCGARMEE